MRDMYFNLDYRDYKKLEDQMRRFAETEHGEGTDFYHKSIRLIIGEDLTIEFHGPNVKARQAAPE